MNIADKMDKIMLKKSKKSKKAVGGYPFAKAAFMVGLATVFIEALKICFIIPVKLSDLTPFIIGSLLVSILLGVFSFLMDNNPKKYNLLICIGIFIILQLPIAFLFYGITLMTLFSPSYSY